MNAQFVWAPNKGEARTAYIERAMSEQPNLGLNTIMRAEERTRSSGALAEAFRVIDSLPSPAIVYNERARPAKPKKASEAALIALEAECAALRLENFKLRERVETLQRLIREQA